MLTYPMGGSFFNLSHDTPGLMRVTFEGLCSNCEGDASCSCKIEDVYLVKFMERGDNSTKERIF